MEEIGLLSYSHSNYTEQALKILDTARKTAQKMHQGAIGSEYLLYALLAEKDTAASSVLKAHGLKTQTLLELIDGIAVPESEMGVDGKPEYTPEAESVLKEAYERAQAMKADRTGSAHLLIGILEDSKNAARSMIKTLGGEPGKIYLDILSAIGKDQELSKEDKKALKSGKKIKKTATPVLDQFSTDLTKKAEREELDPLLGREAELARLIRTLSRRSKNNPCLIGEPGVGKTAIVEGLAQRIVMDAVPDHLLGKRIINLDLSAMVAGTKYRGEFEERIKSAINEVKRSKNVILFVDELHTMIGAGGAEGSMDASNILKPALSRGEVQLIGATTIEEYRKYIEKDAALERRFQPITIEEPTVEETIHILKGLRSRFEHHHGLKISDEGIQAAAVYSERYINDRFLPDKAIDLIDEAASKTHLTGYRIPNHLQELKNKLHELNQEKENLIAAGNIQAASAVHAESKEVRRSYEKALERFHKQMSKSELVVGETEVAEVIADWTHIPVQKLTEDEASRLNKMEQLLHRRVIAQDAAITAVSKAVRRGRVGLKDPGRPIGSFLFLGPTGVGKTEISKALAEAVFGTEDAMIRVDMSEYMEKHSVSKMIGSPPGYVGYDEGGQLSEKVRRNPYSVILFDEIEKAHPDVFNILLQVLDDGHITDAHGRKVDFKNTIIIMTSNAGAKSIIEPKKLGFTTQESEEADYERMKSQVMEEVRRIFKPEFLNRIDEVIVFHALNKAHMKQIVTLLTKNLTRRCAEQLQITFTVRDSVKKYIVENAYDPKYGARPLRRKIQTDIEDPLAEELLAGRIKRGDKVAAGVKNGKIEFYVLDKES